MTKTLIVVLLALIAERPSFAQGPLCCAGDLVDVGRAFAAGRLNPFTGVNGAETRISLDALAGVEWVLRAWDFNEPASLEPPVTLSYENARFSGSGGCNRYFAGVTAGNMPGEISVSAPASTRMACGEAADRAEGRFLAQLGAAEKFAFVVGQLGVTYRKNDGSLGTMLFSGRAPQTSR